MIGQYTLYEWVLYFYIYCFLGWVFESCYVSLRTKKWVNRGFLHGPFLPIYGSGAVMMLFVSEPFKENLILTYFAGLFGATLLELITGAGMEALFKVRYWDYTEQKFNYKGYICLSSSLVWGLFTVLMNEAIHPALLFILAALPQLWETSFVIIVTSCLAVDVYVSVRDAIDLRNILIGMENVRKEALILRKRADVVIAVLDQEWREYVKTHPAVERLDGLGKEMELRFEKMKKMLDVNVAERIPERQKEELLEVRERFESVLERSTRLKRKGEGGIRKILQGNPSMVSSMYDDGLIVLKRFLKENRPGLKMPGSLGSPEAAQTAGFGSEQPAGADSAQTAGTESAQEAVGEKKEEKEA